MSGFRVHGFWEFRIRGLGVWKRGEMCVFWDPGFVAAR